MKYLSKSVIAVLGAAAMASASAASAQTVSPTGPVTIEGTLNQSLLGGQFPTQCHVVFQGTADASGFTLTSYTGTQVGGTGNLACDDSIVFPVRIDAVSPTSLEIQNITISTRLGECRDSNIPLAWSNAGSSVTFPVGTAIQGICEFNGTLTVSPATTISN